MTTMTIPCSDGTDVIIEVTPPGVPVFHGYDHESAIAADALGLYDDEPDLCFEMWKALVVPPFHGGFELIRLLDGKLDPHTDLLIDRGYVELLIAMNVAVDVVTSRERFFSLSTQYSPLTLAIQEGRAGVVRTLLEAGADPNGEEATAPMKEAVDLGKRKEREALEIIDLLFEHGFDDEIQLQHAAHEAADSVAIMRRLVRGGFSPDFALRIVVDTSPKDDVKMAMMLVEEGANPCDEETIRAAEQMHSWAIEEYLREHLEEQDE